MTDLWSLTIAFRGREMLLRMTFDGEDIARAAYEALKRPGLPADFDRGVAVPTYEPTVETVDSYGVTATVDRDTILAHWLTSEAAQSRMYRDASAAIGAVTSAFQGGAGRQAN